MSSGETVKVVVRCRPLGDKEKKHRSCVDIVNGDADVQKVVCHKVCGDGVKANKSHHAESFDSLPSYHIPGANSDRHTFSFDRVFDENSKQEEIYEEICKPIVESVCDGYNGTVFAYGQTGTGKTYTMTGGVSAAQMGKNKESKEVDPSQHGIVPRAFQQIFEYVKEQRKIVKGADSADGAEGGTTENQTSVQAQTSNDSYFVVRCSFVEIYNEGIRDLLSNDPKALLELREDEYMKKNQNCSGVYVENLSSYICSDEHEMLAYMIRGNKNRAVSKTKMNEASSRSHSIFTVTVEKVIVLEEEFGTGTGVVVPQTAVIRTGKLNMVDLAGSERQAKTQASGKRFEEATKINLSLFTLGHVISALAEKSAMMRLNKAVESDPTANSTIGDAAGAAATGSAVFNSHNRNCFIPYRNSKLTRLLQDSLGGNSKTVMIANIGPAEYNYDETLSTLRYADRVKSIVNKPVVNEDPKDRLITELQNEVALLKAAIASKDNEIAGLKVELTSTIEEKDKIIQRKEEEIFVLRNLLAIKDGVLGKLFAMLEEKERRIEVLENSELDLGKALSQQVCSNTISKILGQEKMGEYEAQERAMRQEIIELVGKNAVGNVMVEKLCGKLDNAEEKAALQKHQILQLCGKNAVSELILKSSVCGFSGKCDDLEMQIEYFTRENRILKEQVAELEVEKENFALTFDEMTTSQNRTEEANMKVITELTSGNYVKQMLLEKLEEENFALKEKLFDHKSQLDSDDLETQLEIEKLKAEVVELKNQMKSVYEENAELRLCQERLEEQNQLLGEENERLRSDMEKLILILRGLLDPENTSRWSADEIAELQKILINSKIAMKNTSAHDDDSLPLVVDDCTGEKDDDIVSSYSAVSNVSAFSKRLSKLGKDLAQIVRVVDFPSRLTKERFGPCGINRAAFGIGAGSIC